MKDATMMTRTIRSILLTAGALLIAVSCFAQGTESDLVTPTPEQILREAGLSPSPDDVLKALSSENPGIREAAAQLAGERRITQAIPKLQQLLSDRYELARVAAAASLQLMGDSSGIPTLQKLLDSPTAIVVIRAARTLAAAGDMSGFAEIGARLTAGKEEEGDRIVMIDALPWFQPYEQLRQQARLLLIRSALDDPSADVRMVAVQHLTADVSPDAQAALVRAQQKETDPVIRGVLTANQQRRAAKQRQQ
jgi:HEAT repeat protein